MNLSNKIGRQKLLVFGFLLIIHLVIFHKIVYEIPSIIRGESTIVRDELIPFFNFNSQFFDQIIGGDSSLTSTDEIRISYSFWTSWVRYNTILPFAIVLLNTISAFLLFLAVYIVTRKFFTDDKYVILSSFLASIAIHIILLYSKITHFYTLIFGFSLFALAISLTIKEFFYGEGFSFKRTILISLLVLFNPAIHYHILYYIVLFLLIFSCKLLGKSLKLPTFKYYLKYFGYILLFSLIPYIFLILYISKASVVGVSNSIPVNYWSIVYSSTPFSQLISLGIAAPIDMFQYGFYLIPIPRYLNIILFIVTITVFFSKNKLPREKRGLALAFYSIFLFAIFMSIGYQYSFSFHSILAKLMILVSNTQSVFTSIFERVIQITIQILRFPQRFTFISFYFGAILISISLVILGNYLKSKYSYVLLILLMMSPFIFNNDYRIMLFSGDYNKFLTPLRIPKDLDEIKKIITKEPGKLFILPTLESGRDIIVDNNRYNFIDKFIIYYLDSATFYYGTSSKIENKIYASGVYQSIMDDNKWWERVLNQSLNIKYIVQPKTENRSLGQVYLSGIDSKIQKALDDSTIYKKIYDGEIFSLYEKSSSILASDSILVDLPFNKIDEDLKKLKTIDEHMYFPLETNIFLESQGNKYIFTDDPQRAYYDVLNGMKNLNIALPSTKIIPFTDNLISSSFYTNLPLSFSTLLDEDNPYNFIHRLVPDIINLNTAQFVGTVQNKIPVDFNFDIPKGEYSVYLKASFTKDVVEGNFGSTKILFNKITNDSKNSDVTNFAYFKSDKKLDLEKGKMSFHGILDDSLIVESLLFIPGSLEYTFSTNQVGSKNIQLIPTDNKYIYKLDFSYDKSI